MKIRIISGTRGRSRTYSEFPRLFLRQVRLPVSPLGHLARPKPRYIGGTPDIPDLNRDTLPSELRSRGEASEIRTRVA